MKEIQKTKTKQKSSRIGRDSIPEKRHGNQTIIITNSSSGMDVNAYGDEKDGDEAKENDGVNKNG